MLFKGSVQQNLEQLWEKETIKDHQRSVSLGTENSSVVVELEFGGQEM